MLLPQAVGLIPVIYRNQEDLANNFKAAGCCVGAYHEENAKGRILALALGVGSEEQLASFRGIVKDSKLHDLHLDIPDTLSAECFARAIGSEIFCKEKEISEFFAK